MSRNLYSILELDRNADSSEIRKQYLKLSRQYHPDKAPSEKKEEATHKFKEINAAYEVLSDDGKKSFYDQTGEIPGENNGGGGGMPPGFSMGGGMPFGFNMGDLFGMFGGGPGGPRGPSRGKRPGKAPERKTQIPLTLKDFYYGRKIQIHLERQRFCPDCKGDGYINTKSCGDCGGSGSKTQIIQMGTMIMQNTGPCMACRGSGKTRGDSCFGCNGSKFIKQDKNLELNILKGMKPGETISFPGESSHVEDFTDPGDVVVELVAADEDHAWERQGDTLRHRVGLTLGEALCGKVVRLDGHPAHDSGVFIQIPRGVQNRQEIVVEGLGMPRSGGTSYGDAVLILTVLPSSEERSVLDLNVEHLRTLFRASNGDTTDGLVWTAKSIVY